MAVKHFKTEEFNAAVEAAPLVMVDLQQSLWDSAIQITKLFCLLKK